MPNKEAIKKALAAIKKRRANYEYFFDHLKSHDWIKPLSDAGMFRDPQKPIQEGHYIRFPLWPESRYLLRMASQAPEIVLKVILQIPDTDNVRVHEDFIDAALAMPASLAAKLAPKAKQWIELPYQLLLPEKLIKLAVYLAKGDQVTVALDLAKALLAPIPDPRATNDISQEELAYRLSPEPQSRFSLGEYKAILKEEVLELLKIAKGEVFALLCDLLDRAIELSRHPAEEGEEISEDHYSYVWRPAIEDHRQNSAHSLKDLLVTAVRNAAERIVQDEPSEIMRLVEKLESYGWIIFQRIALHLLRVCPGNATSLIIERITDRSRFDESSLWHEYILLARDRFPSLPQEVQSSILQWIKEGPDLEQLKIDMEQWHGRALTQEEIARDADHWRLKKLDPLRSVLPADWNQYHEALIAQLGKPKYPSEFISYSTSWTGPTSPKSIDDLKAMSIKDIVALLKDWQPSGGLLGPSPEPEGLGRVLTAVVAAEPERFAVAAESFHGLNLTYVRALFDGFREAIREKRSFTWKPVLELCHRTSFSLQSPRPDMGRGLARDCSWTRKAIAALLAGGFEPGASTMPFELRELAWNILCPLTDDEDPTPEDEASQGGSNMDPVTLSINTTRGEAMHAVVRHALWIRRYLEKSPQKKEQLALGFETMPEVREVLDAHLNPALDPSLAIRAVYGQWFPWLALLDQRWAAVNISRIFPTNEAFQDLRDAAWEAYIVFCEPYSEVFEVLGSEYQRAVDQIGNRLPQRRRRGNPEEHLASHLMVFYWRGKLSLEEPDGLLSRFYQNASDELCGYAFATEGRRLHETEETIPQKILKRLQILWEHRLAVAQIEKVPGAHTTELAAFGWWFTSAKFDTTWAIDQLLAALKISPKMQIVDHLISERLAALAADMPWKTVECLRLIAEGDTESWRTHAWSEHARAILATAIQSTDTKAREAAIDLVHRLGARGYFEFRDLLPQTSAAC